MRQRAVPLPPGPDRDVEWINRLGDRAAVRLGALFGRGAARCDIKNDLENMRRRLLTASLPVVFYRFVSIFITTRNKMETCQ